MSTIHPGFRFRFVLAAFVVSCFTFSLYAQVAPVPLPKIAAPIPTRILSAKRIFLSNAGADSGLFPEPFTGDPSRPYNALYAALQSSGKYELVSDPSDADLVLEIQLTAPNGPAHANKAYGASDPVPMFRLTVLDQKTHYVLWALTTSIDIAFRQKTHDRNFDEALTLLVDEFEALSNKTAVPSSQSSQPSQ